MKLMEEHKAILKDVFGESSDSEDEEKLKDDSSKGRGIWEPIPEINGLWLCTDFLSPDKQSSLLSSIEEGSIFKYLSLFIYIYLILDLLKVC